MDDFLANVPELCNADQRAFLYSDLERQRTDNPDGYSTAFTFWTQLLVSAQRAGVLGPSRLVLSTEALDSRFAFRGDTPTGLPTIVRALPQRLQPLSDFLAPWPRRLLGWALGQFPLMPRRLPAMLAMGAFHVDVDAYVVMEVVKEVAQQLTDYHYAQVEGPFDNLMDISGFARRFQHIISTDIDLKVMLKHLQDTRRITTRQVHEQTLIRFAASQAEHITVLPSIADMNTLQVTNTQNDIAHQVALLEQRTKQLDNEVRQALANKQRTLAMSKLKMKHFIESGPLAKRLDALEQISQVVLQLQQTHSDIQLIQAFEAGTRSLQSLNQIASKHDPDAIFDQWKDEVLKANELESALAANQLVPDEGEDVQSDLEAELDALVREQEVSQEDLELSAAFGCASISDEPKASPPAKGSPAKRPSPAISADAVLENRELPGRVLLAEE
ncbi:hypothetical protein EC988_000199 [Linderina pennispora]|nr:hypothetical protein EC988_000199 [Linderina pennispora]